MGRFMKASERVAVLATVDPDALTATTHDSDWVDVRDFNRILAVAMAGTLGSSATFDAALRQATDSSGSNPKAISGKSITQLTQAGTDQSDTQAVINLAPYELDVAGGYTHVSLRITVGAATSDGGGFIIGIDPKYGQADDFDLASVAEVVA